MHDAHLNNTRDLIPASAVGIKSKVTNNQPLLKIKMNPISYIFKQSFSENTFKSRGAFYATRVALVAVLFFYVRWIIYVFLNPYLPSAYVNDGFGYYLSSKSFFINKTLSAPLIHLDKVSPIGEFYSHGFAYPLLNGTIAIILGWSDHIIIVVNIAIAAIVVTLLSFGKDRLASLLIILIISTFYIMPTMTLSYMQETIHILFAVVASLLIIRIASTNERLRWPLVAVLYGTLVVAALFRPLWLLWSIALLALGRTPREYCIHIGLAAAGLLMSVIFMRLFFAPYPYYSPQDTILSALRENNTLGAISFIVQTIHTNIKKLYIDDFYIFGNTRIPNIYTLIIISVNFYFIYQYFKLKDRIFLAGFIIGTIYIGAVFSLYDTLAGARQLAAVFVMQIIFLGARGYTKLIAAIAIFQLILFPRVAEITKHVVKLQQNAGVAAKTNSDDIAEIQRISDLIHEGRRTTIYVDRELSNADYPLIIHYPVQSADHYPIRYSLDMFTSSPIDKHVFNSFFDYILSATPISRKDLLPIYEGKSYHLYRRL